MPTHAWRLWVEMIIPRNLWKLQVFFVCISSLRMRRFSIAENFNPQYA